MLSCLRNKALKNLFEQKAQRSNVVDPTFQAPLHQQLRIELNTLSTALYRKWGFKVAFIQRRMREPMHTTRECFDQGSNQSLEVMNIVRRNFALQNL